LNKEKTSNNRFNRIALLSWFVLNTRFKARAQTTPITRYRLSVCSMDAFGAELEKE
jgi:hypothetical protein